MSQDKPSHDEKFADITLREWESAFNTNITEFSATKFVFTPEDQDLIRVAFGNNGPFTSKEGHRDQPRYTHAVTLPPSVAVVLAEKILAHYGRPKTAD